MANEVAAASGSLVRLDTVMDLNFIQRNIRDLSKTAQFSHMAELDELHKIAYDNLKSHMAPGRALAEDPQLALETYKTLSGVVMQVVETKRKAADTLIKARVLVDAPRVPDLLGDEDIPHDEVNEAVVGDSGVFGKLATDQQPDLDIAI